MELEKLLALIALVVLSAGLVALVIYMLRARHRTEKAWRSFAAGLGATGQLEVHVAKGEWPTLVGTYRGRSVNVRVVTRGSSDSRSFHTVVSTDVHRQLPNNFELQPQGMFFALQKAYGAQDIELGDPDFDRAFVVEGADEGSVRALLSDGTLRGTLVRQAQSEPGLRVSGGQVVVEQRDVRSKTRELSSMLDAATMVGDALEKAAEAPAMRQYAQAAGGTQQWLLERDHMRVFAVVMTVPVGLFVAIGLSGVLPSPFGPVGWPIAALGMAIVAKMAWPPRPHLRLDEVHLTLDRGRERVVVPLRGCTWWCSPWHQRGYVCGTLLHLQAGEAKLVIGGAQHGFEDPRFYQAEPGGHPDVVMLKAPFVDLLNGIGYAMRRLHGAQGR